MRIAVVGIGLMGRAIAERLHACGHTVIAYNRTAEKTQSLTALGIAVASTAAQAVSTAEVVLLVLSDASAIRAVLAMEGLSDAAAGKLVVQMGTIAPVESVAIESAVRTFGSDYVEAPVLGSLAEARSGTLLAMVGGTPEQFEQMTPWLRHLSAEPLLVGPVGQAAALKLALNQLIASHIASFSLSVAYLRQAGVSVDAFRHILAKSALAPPMFEKKFPRLASRDYTNPNFSVRMLLKDVRLIETAAAEAAVDTRALQGIAALLEKTLALGRGDEDYAALYEAVTPTAPPPASPASRD